MPKDLSEKRDLLIIEDEPSLSKQLKWGLGKQYHVAIANNADKARQLMQSTFYPVITLDLGLPPTPDKPDEGFRLLEEMPRLSPYTKVAVITGNDERENAIKAIALGAEDFCAKPIDLDMLKIILERTFKISALEKEVRRVKEIARAEHSLCGMYGKSQSMKSLFGYIRQISDTVYPVLIQGESGTGKEMVANAIHQLSRRANQPLVAINCAAIPENLLESELFGYEKGSFTGADNLKTGKLEKAHLGTLFLDEIGDMPLGLQSKLLRFLQEDTIERVGGTETIKLDVRVLAATNVDIQQAVFQGRFRGDLYFRLKVVPINIPPLRKRPEDILFLAHLFIDQESLTSKQTNISLSAEARQALTAHKWNGNVRELQNRVRRAMASLDGHLINPWDLGLGEEESSQTSQECEPLEDAPLRTLAEARDEAERRTIIPALTAADNNITKAAELLGVSRPTLHNLLRKHNIEKANL